MSQDVGAMPPPEGVTPDFDGSTTLQHSVVVVYSCTFAIATVTLALRLYSASAIVRKLDWDIRKFGHCLKSLNRIANGCFSVGDGLVREANTTNANAAIPSGFGKHLWDVRATDLQGYLNLLLVLGLTYVWPPTLAKLAILVLYYRLIPNSRFRFALYAVAAGLIIYTLVFTILLAGPCHPQKAGTGTCVVNLTVSQAVLNIVSDVIVIILPIPFIHRLNMPLKQRITVGFLLALGSAVVIVSCIRFGYVQKMRENPDVTWTQASASLWSCIEMNTGIICNCLAHLKPFVRRHIPWLAKFVSGTSQQKSYPDDVDNSHSFKRWRGDKASHGYQLHSVGRSQEPAGTSMGNNVVVVDEFQVEFTQARNAGEASSTEDILVHKTQRT
ncbi:hypothetical protein BHE90_000714 [Fusarium euwallaceae]|uniref:Rhodopsin domain-containing protein n=3 Tax=Fusarium solani species complex TaxID=232080 RepID=A0A430M9V5_9HYPO|nr:hypothetical protein CEP51_003214 [Fusarium floridanum]RSM20183.1 hypothetical protein CDV31_000978 [Fusarium ambrosium]RTE84723.1 hypothetical protein BHE90_000714 [Fusarium euwallaceae]